MTQRVSGIKIVGDVDIAQERHDVESPNDADAPFGPILQRIALAANSSLDVDEVLDRLARLTLEAIPGDRCAIFLLDEQQQLVPRQAAGRVPNEEEFQRFLATPPIDLKDHADRWQAFCAGRVLYFPDLASSPLVPKHFAEAFGARCALLVPLMASDEPLGLLTLDWSVPDRACTEEETTLLEAIGAYVALAIRNGRLYEETASKAQTLERLVGLADALNSAAALNSVLELVCEAFEELLGTNACVVNLIDVDAPGGFRTIAARGDASEAPTARTKTTTNDIDRMIEAFEHSPEVIVHTDLDESPLPTHLEAFQRSGSAVMFPLWRSERLLGYVLTMFSNAKRPDAENLAIGQALADLAATATSRARLHHELQRRLQRVEILHLLAEVVAGAAQLGPMLQQLNDRLPKELGIQLESVTLANAVLRNAMSSLRPSREDQEAMRSWRAIIGKRQSPAPLHRSRGRILVPIAQRQRVVGVLRVVVDADATDPPDDALLGAIASACAEVVYKGGLHRELAESERRLAVVAERERIARDLHDSVGQLLTGLGLRLAEYAAEAPDTTWESRLTELCDQATSGSRHIRDAIQSLLFLQVRNKGLARSLRELTRTFEMTTGIEVELRVSGDVAALATVAEDALFRVAREALMNVERHARASVVRVALNYGTDGVTVTVTDDGAGMSADDLPGQAESHYGLDGLRRLLEDISGELVLSNLVPKGFRVEGHIPLRTRAKASR